MNTHDHDEWRFGALDRFGRELASRARDEAVSRRRRGRRARLALAGVTAVAVAAVATVTIGLSGSGTTPAQASLHDIVAASRDGGTVKFQSVTRLVRAGRVERAIAEHGAIDFRHRAATTAARSAGAAPVQRRQIDGTTYAKVGGGAWRPQQRTADGDGLLASRALEAAGLLGAIDEVADDEVRVLPDRIGATPVRHYLLSTTLAAILGNGAPAEAAGVRAKVQLWVAHDGRLVQADRSFTAPDGVRRVRVLTRYYGYGSPVAVRAPVASTDAAPDPDPLLAEQLGYLTTAAR